MELIFRSRSEIEVELDLLKYPIEVTALSGPGTDCVETVLEARMESLAGDVRAGRPVGEAVFESLGKTAIDLLRVIKARYPHLVTMGKFELAELLWTKHQAYGAKPIRKWGVAGLAIRLDSKFERFVTLSRARKDSMGDESLVDTIQDFIGYCAIGKRMLRD